MPWHALPTGPAAPAPAVSAAAADVKRARQQHTALINRRAALQQKIADLASARERSAFAAATGDRAAKTENADRRREAAEAGIALEDLDHAIAEAKRQVASAEAAEARAVRCAEATTALAIAGEMRVAGSEASEALTAFLARYQRFFDRSVELSRLNVGAPRGELISERPARCRFRPRPDRPRSNFATEPEVHFG